MSVGRAVRVTLTALRFGHLVYSEGGVDYGCWRLRRVNKLSIALFNSSLFLLASFGLISFANSLHALPRHILFVLCDSNLSCRRAFISR